MIDSSMLSAIARNSGVDPWSVGSLLM